MNKSLLTLICGASAILPSQAAIIGVEGFDYADGPIENQAGGSGFNYDNVNATATATTSDWDNVGGTPNVSGGTLVTSSSSAKREYNGNIEGSAGGDGPDTERAGAARGAGVVFYQVTINRSAGASWSGLSSYDFGSERVFFGVPNGNSATDTIGVAIGGVETYGGFSLVDGTSYVMIAVLDFNNDTVGLFIDPDGSTDFWNTSDGSNSADVTAEYTASNWSTGARLGSGGSDGVTWDDLTIAIDDPTNVGLLAAAVPEPSTGLLGSLAVLLLFRRRK